MLQQWQKYNAHKATGTAHTKNYINLSAKVYLHKPMCTKYHRELVYQLPPTILSKESCSWLQKSYKSANEFETDKGGYDSPSSWQASNGMRQPLIQQHLNRELQKIGRMNFTIITCHFVPFQSAAWILEPPNFSLLRVLHNKCVRSATFAHLNNGCQRNTFWHTFFPTTCWQSTCMYSLFPPCSVINNCVNNSCRLIQAASRLIQD